MGFFKSKKGSIISDYFFLLETIGNYAANNAYEVALYDDHLEISSPLQKNKILLPYSQITDVFHGYQTELVQKERSTIGRAAVGGLLFGGVGAVVGAVSGTKDKTVKETKLYLIISYTSSEGKESYLQFEDTRKWHGKKLAATLKEKCNLPTTESDKQDIQL